MALACADYVAIFGTDMAIYYHRNGAAAVDPSMEPAQRKTFEDRQPVTYHTKHSTHSKAIKVNRVAVAAASLPAAIIIGDTAFETLLAKQSWK